MKRLSDYHCEIMLIYSVRIDVNAIGEHMETCSRTCACSGSSAAYCTERTHQGKSILSETQILYIKHLIHWILDILQTFYVDVFARDCDHNYTMQDTLTTLNAASRALNRMGRAWK